MENTDPSNVTTLNPLDRGRRLNGFTLVEVLVVMLIISLLTSIYMSVFVAVRAKARGNVCLNQMRQINMAVLQYVQDHDETMPIGATSNDPGGSADTRWYQAIAGYVQVHDKNLEAAGVFICPDKPDFKSRAGGYGINANLVGSVIGGTLIGKCRTLPEITEPVNTFLICDAAELDASKIASTPDPKDWVDIQALPTDFQATPPSSWDGSVTYYTGPPNPDNMRRPVGRHQSGLNVVYVDGHIKWNHIGQFLGPMPGGWPYGDPRNTWDNK